MRYWTTSVDIFNKLCFAWTELYYSSQRGTKSHLKKQFHLKSQFPPEMTSRKVPAKLSVPPEIKWPVPSWNQMACSLPWPVHSHFQDDWSQVNKRHTFTDRHLLIPINSEGLFSLFMHSHKRGLTIGLMIKPLLWECINKLENYI